MEKIAYVQVWDKVKFPKAQFWDDIQAEQISGKDTKECSDIAQNMSDSANAPVRLTYPANGLDIRHVGRLNGAYLIPSKFQLKEVSI